jgi:hypothetical protein
MKLRIKESLLILILIIVFIAIGFFRDAVFMNINSQLYKLYFKNYEFTLPNWLSVFSDWPYMRLYYFKYFLTAFFVVIYLLLSVLTVRIMTGDLKRSKWVYYAYGIVIAMASITYLGGYLINNFPKGYLFSRNLLGLLQSPFIIMIIIPALKLEQQKVKEG